MENQLLEIILQTVPGAAALVYIIFFQGKEIAKHKAEVQSLKLQNEQMHLKNERLYLQVIQYLEGMIRGKKTTFKVPGNED